MRFLLTSTFARLMRLTLRGMGLVMFPIYSPCTEFLLPPRGLVLHYLGHFRPAEAVLPFYSGPRFRGSFASITWDLGPAEAVLPLPLPLAL